MNNIIFGPIHSRRFGKSLGMDLSPSKKQCNYDCLYCELEPAKTVDTQEEVLSVDAIVDAVQKGLDAHSDIDVLTITANGEPTLYPHLSELIDRINAIKGSIQTLILSNGSTIADPAVQEALLKIDTVKLSLDCASQKCLKKIDRMHGGIDAETIKQGMRAFRARSNRTLVIEVLIVRGINDTPESIAGLNDFLCMLQPDRVDLGTIDRPPAYRVEPVGDAELQALAGHFDPMLPVHIAYRKPVPIAQEFYDDDAILSTLSKRPLTPEDIALLMDDASQKRLDRLIGTGKIAVRQNKGMTFYVARTAGH